MPDEPNQPVVEEEVVEQPQSEGQVPEPQEQEQQQEETPEVEEQPQEQEPQETPQPSRREQLRVQDLLKKYGPPQAKQAPSQSGPNFRERVQADEEVYKDLEETAQKYGQDQYQAGQNVAEYTTWKRFLQMDENQVRGKYDILDPSKGEVYHGTLEKALQEKYLRFVGYDQGDPQRGIAPTVQNPDISYADFVEAEMEFSDELASQKVATTTQNIAKQAANTGLRPDGSSPKRMDLSKDPGAMSDDELKAAIKATMPRDNRGRFTSR